MEELFTRNDNIQRTLKPVQGGHMSAVHFGDMSQPATMVFLHSTGFHALTYRTMLENLDIHVIALDLRGHGQTQLPAIPNSFSSFRSFAKDVVSYLHNHIQGEIILCGHSLGASIAILCSQMAPHKVSRVLAFDPVVLPPSARLMMSTNIGRKHLQKTLPIASNAGRRRDTFDSVENAYERLKKRGIFKTFTPEILWDYVSAGIVPNPDESQENYRLACRPQWEQFIYTAQSHNIKKAILTLPENSHILMTNFVKPTNWIPKMRKKCPHIRIDHHPELDHFFPLLNPEISLPAIHKIMKN